MSDHDELITRFIEISGGDENIAQFYLSSSNWSLEDALSNFLGNQAEDEASIVSERGRPGGETDAIKITDTTAATGGTQVPKASGSGSSSDADFSKLVGAKPKFATLNDMSKRSANEEEGQAFYAGGSERSGQQVLGPPKRKNFREQLTDIFKMAQEQRDPDDNAGPSTSATPNWGQGIRLGMTSSDHTVLPAADASQAKGEKRPLVVLKLWSQGFSVDDGELRLYDDPQNKEFLETVMRGEIPHELLEMGWMVNVDVEDHRHEDYKSPSAKTMVFKGSGQALGSPVPNVESVAAKPPPSTTAAAVVEPASNTTDDENSAKTKLNFNSSEPSTSLQVRLADGSRLTAQFNLSHTIADIQEYIQNARPQYRNRNFVLVSSFPTRELTDASATVESAGLKNAALMQRLK